MIDLAAFPRQTLLALHSAGMACVYVLAYDGGRPCRVGYAKRPAVKIGELRRANAAALHLHHITWTPSLGVAMVIDQGARDQIQPEGIQREWHDCPVSEAIAAINFIVQSLYSNAERVMTHEQMLRRMSANKPMCA